MSSLDWTVLAVYLVSIVSFGYWVGRGNRKIDDFFLAGRAMPWWAVGLSVMATQISAITLIGTTSQAYNDGMRFLVVYFALPFAMVILCLTLVPFFYRAQVFTAYEYLERRFDLKTRTLTSFLFLMQRGMSMGVTLYAPSLVLSTLFGLPESLTILVMGGSTILYVMKGGNKAVIWTDVVQMAVVWTGIFTCFYMAVHNLPEHVSFRGALAIAQASGRLNATNLDTSLETPYTLWSGLIGGLFLMLSYFGCDQSQVQRYLSGSSLTQSRLSLLFNAFLKVPMQFIILLTGVLVFVFFNFQQPPALFNSDARAKYAAIDSPEKTQADARYTAAFEARRAAALELGATRQDAAADRYRTAQAEFADARTNVTKVYREATQTGAYNDINYIFLHYVLTQIPHGIIGLIVAVIFAAAMSALSGELNSLATATMIDFVRRFRSATKTDAHDMLLSRILTALWGGFACLVALQAGKLGSAIEVVNKFGSYFYGSILGVFMLAVLTKRANGTGATVGLFIGMGIVGLVATTTKVHFLWWNVVGTVAVFVAGYLISLAVPSPEQGLIMPKAGATILGKIGSPVFEDIAGATAFDSFYLKDRYGSKAMRAIWSDLAMVQAWLDCEAALAHAEADAGIVPRAAARAIAKAARVENINLPAMRAEFDQTWNPVLPLVNALRARLPERAAQWVHWGATSKNIMDTGSAIQIKATYGEVYDGLDRIERALVVLARKHRDTLMAARTHGQQAIPVTLGYKIAVWIDEIRRQRERLLESEKRVLVCEFGGAVGTMAATGKVGLRIQERFAARLGLGFPLIPTKTAGDRFAEFFLLLSSISGTLSKIAASVYNHQQTDIDELSEFSVGKIGSSAMPHKLNPVASGSVVLLFRLIKARSGAVLDYLHCEWEDDHRQGETLWSFGPEISLLFGAQLEMLARVLETLIVKPENMLRNLDRTGGAVLSEALMMALAKRMGRDAAHAHVLGLSRLCRAENRSFCAVARSDEKVKAFVSPLALEKALDYRSGIGLSTFFVDTILKQAPPPTRRRRARD